MKLIGRILLFLILTVLTQIGGVIYLLVLPAYPFINTRFSAHLKDRMGLGGYDRIRYHGCHAVRHDDHIHVQIP